jgi:hypothetical protein
MQKYQMDMWKLFSHYLQVQFQFGFNLNSHLGNNKIHDMQLLLGFGQWKVKENHIF